MVGKAIGGVFGQGALGPLFEHLSVVGEALEHLGRLLRSFVEGQWQTVGKTAGRVDDIEHRADQVKTHIRGHLSTSVFALAQRAEIFRLLGEQDDIADHCQRLARFATIRRTPCPAELAGPLTDLADEVVGAGTALVAAVRAANAGDSAMPSLDAELMAITDRHGTAMDLVQAFLKTLFENEERLDPVSAIFLMRIGEQLGRISDRISNAAETYHRAGLTGG